MNSTDPTQLFDNSFLLSRHRFIARATELGLRVSELPVAPKSPSGESLSIAIAVAGPESASTVLVQISGLHGVEGFAGSAVQGAVIGPAAKLPAGVAVAWVHCLNPFGMAWLRRVNENNVDLNRNCVTDSKGYRGAPELYGRLDRLINPASPPSSDLFLLRCVLTILRGGFSKFKQALAEGQYEYPKGLFFGGSELQEGPKVFFDWLRQTLTGADRVVVIDVHTGLGKRGEDVLLVNAPNDGSNVADRLDGEFHDRIQSMDPADSVAYEIRGAFADGMRQALPSAEVTYITQEFGAIKPLPLLHILREENRWHHYGGGAVDHPTKHRLKQSFCPDDSIWKRSVVERGAEVFDRVFSFLG